MPIPLLLIFGGLALAQTVVGAVQTHQMMESQQQASQASNEMLRAFYEQSMQQSRAFYDAIGMQPPNYPPGLWDSVFPPQQPQVA